MAITIDEDAKLLTVERDGEKRELALYSDESFELLSEIYLKVNWNQKYVYTFSWLGRPIIQLPDDMIRLQEVIHRVQPDVIVETGVAHGGSLVFYASLCRAMGKGRVIGIDIEIRPHNREAIESHPLADLIELVEGSSTDPDIVQHIQDAIGPDQTTLIILDSDHCYAHVARELEAYASMVSVGSYIVATDGYMAFLTDVPRGEASWGADNPRQAALDFVAKRTDFVEEQPPWSFNESTLSNNVTHWPSAYLKRVE